MSWKLMLDHHVPVAIAAGLRGRSIDVLTTEEDGSEELEDTDLLRRSSELRRVLVTFDRDFLQISADWQREGTFFQGIAYVSRRLPQRELLDQLEYFCQAAREDEVMNRLTGFPLQ